ncbi:MAG: hypothetical protein PHS86_11600 [Syntrophaceae bacterium]|nr:hypothetical protein [Syntrophaceae bacterium]
MNKKQWTTLGLTKKQTCFLDGVSKQCKFSGGKKFSRTAIIRACLKAVRKIGVDVTEVKTERDLKERFSLSFKKST